MNSESALSGLQPSHEGCSDSEVNHIPFSLSLSVSASVPSWLTPHRSQRTRESNVFHLGQKDEVGEESIFFNPHRRACILIGERGGGEREREETLLGCLLCTP